MQADLFAGEPAGPRPDVLHRPRAFDGDAGSPLTLEAIRDAVPLVQHEATMYGKVLKVPRLEAWFGKRPYGFGGRVVQPQPLPQVLVVLKEALKLLLGESFDSCFVNYYRDGTDYIAWHADDEPWIGPVIASVSFGAARRFVMKHKATGAKHEWSLGNGDLFVMRAGVQQEWLHTVPREPAVRAPRLNLTFRQTVEVSRA